MGTHVYDPTDPKPREDERPSGVPPPGRLGASRNELLGLCLAISVFVLIALAFWYQATR